MTVMVPAVNLRGETVMEKDFMTWCREYADARMREEYGSADQCPDDDAYDAFLYEAGEEYFLRFGPEENKK